MNRGHSMELRHAWLTVLIWICMVQVPAAMSAAENDTLQMEPHSELQALDNTDRSVTTHVLQTEALKSAYTATAASLTVHDKQAKAIGRIFYVAYTLDQKNRQSRPLTFVFNGGPGAASAYLHLGALGPKRVVFNDDGTIPPMPARIVDNPKNWLVFTDLVFVDPVGTGYSRMAGHAERNNSESEKTTESASSRQGHSRSRVWGIEEDTDMLSRFIRAYLTEENRWLSPVYLVGESYGGFRVARLSRRLQSDYGITPSGLTLISPVLDFSFLLGNERSLWPWVSLLPSYAAVAAIHQRSDRTHYRADRPRASLAQVERFALSEYLSGLAAGTYQPDWRERISGFIGLDEDTVVRWTGRVRSERFIKALLADRNRLLSLYDGSIALVDPDPQSPVSRDFYLDRLNAPLTAAFNSYVRDNLNFRTDLPYLLLNKDVSKSWNWRSGIHGQQGFAEAASDLKQAMSMNPAMQVQIMHGVFDLVTPYFASAIIIGQMALDSLISDNIRLKVYHGGHMPYLHQDTLGALYEDALQFYTGAP